MGEITGGETVTREDIKAVKVEMQRLNGRIAELGRAMEPHGNGAPLRMCSKQTGAVRRASMDLTRALAEMRRSK